MWRKDHWITAEYCNKRAIFIAMDNQAKNGIIEATNILHEQVAHLFPGLEP